MNDICSSTVLLIPDLNDDQQPVESRSWIKESARDFFTVNTLKKRLPIIAWLPSYNCNILLQDAIAGITVGLTAIPQGIAYALVAGLDPEYGLYSAFLGCFVYLFFGSCKDVTVGPTAILAVMVSKYVTEYGADFAVLACFLSGCVILLLGILNMGFMVDFISNPVISGFTTAAALQIASAQIKSLFGLAGSSGNTFSEAVQNLFKNFTTIRLWDTVLGLFTVVILLLLKNLSTYSSRRSNPEFSNFKNFLWKFNWFFSLARNAVVVLLGILIAWCFKEFGNQEPFILTGDVRGGLPPFGLPPFSTVTTNNITMDFTDMISTLGPQSIIIPLISVLETIAIAKAFAKGKMVDATQEMIALGMCNICSSFIRSMPITGSFTRTAINHASGVQTPAGGIFKGLLVLLALGFITKAFYFIPKATLAGLIWTAMLSMIDYAILPMLWKAKKIEFLVCLVTMVSSLFLGLEYGIVLGILMDAMVLLFKVARVTINTEYTKIGSRDIVLVVPSGSLTYCAANHLSRSMELSVAGRPADHTVIVVDARFVGNIDTSVVKNVAVLLPVLEKKSAAVLLWNFHSSVRTVCEHVAPEMAPHFVTGATLDSVIGDHFRAHDEMR